MSSSPDRYPDKPKIIPPTPPPDEWTKESRDMTLRKAEEILRELEIKMRIREWEEENPPN